MTSGYFAIKNFCSYELVRKNKLFLWRNPEVFNPLKVIYAGVAQW